LPLLNDAELGRLLDRVDRVAARVRQADHLRTGGLSLQEEGREVLAREGMAHCADDLTARGLYYRGRVLLEGVTESVIGSQEEPLVKALLHHGAAGPMGERPGVVGPVRCVWRAGRASQFGSP